MRTHAPIQLSFPPPPGGLQISIPSESSSSLYKATQSSSRLSSFADSLTAVPSSQDAAPKRMLRHSQLYDHSQFYVTLDADSAIGIALRLSESNRLPNKSWNFDMNTLNMHLSARVAEVLACAEEMWEFIVECRQRRKSAGRQSPAIAALANVNREEWEDCLARYRM